MAIKNPGYIFYQKPVFSKKLTLSTLYITNHMKFKICEFFNNCYCSFVEVHRPPSPN